MKRMFLCVLPNILWLAPLSAQVKLGFEAGVPVFNDAALVELRNDISGSASPAAWKGLLLPHVNFDNPSVFADSSVWGIAGTATNGALVYNAGTRSTDGFRGVGGYVWSHGAWSALKKKMPPPPPGCSDPGPNAGDLGCVRFEYRGQMVEYTTVRLGDGTIWLQQNLGSLKVADSGRDYRAYGDLFQWGRWDDGHQVIAWNAPIIANATQPPAGSSDTMLAYTLNPNNNPSGITVPVLPLKNPFYNAIRSTLQPTAARKQWWEDGPTTDTWTGNTASAVNGKDPCTVLGPGWRLPTRTEWADMLKNTNNALAAPVTDTGSAFRSYLKIPWPGARNGQANVSTPSGALTGVGMRALFWTSTASGSSDGTAWRIQIHQGYGTNGFEENQTSRGGGQSVRCMK